MPLSAPSLRPRRTRIVFATSCLLATLLCSSGLARAATPPTGSNLQPSDFTILTPRFGSFETEQVDVKLQYITQNEDPTVQVQVNGRRLDDRRLTKSCQGSTCTVTGTLTAWDGLRVGENQLTATLTGRLHLPTSPTASSSTPVLLERTKFDYQYSQGLQSGSYNTINYYTPVSLGLSTIPGGGGAAGTPWLQLTTGYPADFNATADAYAFPNPPGPPDQNGNPTTITTVTIPYPDLTQGFTCTGGTFQAYVLGRQNPYLGGPDDQNVESGACFYSISDLQSFFQSKFNRPLGTQDLVIMSTTPGSTVPAGFDASALGGTNYSKTPASEYPQAYVMIGVYGATPGTAYESFSIPSANNRPTPSSLPALNGTLMVDQNGNYNFIPSGDAIFEVHSDASTGSYVKVGNNTYTPPASSGNNFWLLVLDQETLTPVNYYLSPDASQNCDTTTATQSCGATYAVDADGGNQLATELNSLSNAHDLLFLVAQGCPIQKTPQLKNQLGTALGSIGGVPYAVNAMSQSSNNCAFSLVTVNDGNHTHPLTDPLALSSSAFSSSGQLGSVHGFLARNHQGLYDVAGTAQMVLDTDTNTQVSPADYTFEQTASNQRQDWPLVDTAFPIEAYADVSFQILNALGETGSHLYDVRYFYTASSFLTAGLSTIIENRLADGAPNPVTKSSWDNASPDQFTAARRQLAAELQQITSAYGYLGDKGIRGIMAGSSSTIYADMIGTANDIIKDDPQASGKNADAKLSKELNLVAGIVGIGRVIPDAGPVFGVISGALKVGATAVGPSNKSLPENAFDVTLSDLTQNATTYVANEVAGYDGAVDNILSDTGKLSTIATLTSNSDSNWNLPNQVAPDGVQSALVDGAARSIWLDIIPQLYGIRQFLGGPSPAPGDYGVVKDPQLGNCDNLYRNINAASFVSYPSIDIKTTLRVQPYDLYVFAEGTKGSSHDTTVSGALANLLTTSEPQTIGGNLQDGLNLPPMFLYGYSNMNYGPFPGANGENAGYCVNP